MVAVAACRCIIRRLVTKVWRWAVAAAAAVVVTCRSWVAELRSCLRDHLTSQVQPRLIMCHPVVDLWYWCRISTPRYVCLSLRLLLSSRNRPPHKLEKLPPHSSSHCLFDVTPSPTVGICYNRVAFVISRLSHIRLTVDMLLLGPTYNISLQLCTALCTES